MHHIVGMIIQEIFFEKECCLDLLFYPQFYYCVKKEKESGTIENN